MHTGAVMIHLSYAPDLPLTPVTVSNTIQFGILFSTKKGMNYRHKLQHEQISKPLCSVKEARQKRQSSKDRKPGAGVCRGEGGVMLNVHKGIMLVIRML